MTQAVFPAYLNDAGVTHVTEELHSLGLDWDVEAVCSAITASPLA